jgi:hypothetical protein
MKIPEMERFQMGLGGLVHGFSFIDSQNLLRGRGHLAGLEALAQAKNQQKGNRHGGNHSKCNSLGTTLHLSAPIRGGVGLRI